MQDSSHPEESRTPQEWAQYVLEQSKNATGSASEAALPVEQPSHNMQLRKKRPIDWSKNIVPIDSDSESDYQPSERVSPARYIKREPGLDPSSEVETYTGRRSSLSQYGSWDNDSTRVGEVDDAQEPGTTAIEQHLQSRPSMSRLGARDDSAKKQKRSRLSEDRESERPLSKHGDERFDGTQDVHVTLPASSSEEFQPRGFTRAPSKADEPATRSNTMFGPSPLQFLSSLTDGRIPFKDARTDSNTAIDETIKGPQPTTQSKLRPLQGPEQCRGIKSQGKTPSSPSLPTTSLQVPMQLDDDVRAKEALCPSLSAGSWMIVKSAMQQGVVNLDHWQPHNLATFQSSALDKKIPTAETILGKVFDIHEDMKTLSSDERLASWLKLTVELVFTFPR